MGPESAVGVSAHGAAEVGRDSHADTVRALHKAETERDIARLRVAQLEADNAVLRAQLDELSAITLQTPNGHQE